MTIQDIDLTMSMHPITRGLSIKKDVAAVSQDVVNIVLTVTNELKFNDFEIGASMYDAHFQVADTTTGIMLNDRITEQINANCPLCQLISVDFEFDSQIGELYVFIKFSLVNSDEEITINVPIEVIR